MARLVVMLIPISELSGIVTLKNVQEDGKDFVIAWQANERGAISYWNTRHKWEGSFATPVSEIEALNIANGQNWQIEKLCNKE